ncbi:MAG: cytochrome c-type biogenesis protein CcmH [Alicyclobacillus sp.]|nr:cytochrome c-type biogenesis protein CcmH [Alicyclobacillus sp.]
MSDDAARRLPATGRAGRVAAAAAVACAVAAAAWVSLWTASGARRTADSGSLQSQVLAIAAQLRAPGDHNTMTVATSSLPQAQHMRYEIQQYLLAGRSPEAVKRLLVQEYGPQILAAPAWRGWGGIAWVAPWAVLAAILVAAATYVRRHALRSGAMAGGEPKSHPDGAAGRVAADEPAGGRSAVAASAELRLPAGGDAADGDPADGSGANGAPPDAAQLVLRRLQDYL